MFEGYNAFTIAGAFDEVEFAAEVYKLFWERSERFWEGSLFYFHLFCVILIKSFVNMSPTCPYAKRFPSPKSSKLPINLASNSFFADFGRHSMFLNEFL